MSSDADAAAATVALFNEIYRENYCNTAAGVLFIYDTLVTLDREAACFWTTKRTGGASRLLFFANKWINLVYYVSGSLVPSLRFPSDKRFVCTLYVTAMQAMPALQLVPGAAFSALRAYVLSRSTFLGLLVLAVSLVPVGANLVPYGYQLSGENFPPFGCLRTDNIPAALIPKFGSFNLITYIDTDCVQGNCAVVIISRVPLIAADVLLIYITWTKLRGWAALTNTRQRSKRLSLSEVLYSGGTIYFVILFVLNVLHLVLSVMAVTSDHGDDGQSLVTQFTAPLTAILISRFLLELQEANKMVVELDLDDPSRDPPHSMPSFISSLGGFVNPSLLAWSENDESHELQVRSRSEGGETEDGVPTESPQAAASSYSTASRLSVDILNVP